MEKLFCIPCKHEFRFLWFQVLVIFDDFHLGVLSLYLPIFSFFPLKPTLFSRHEYHVFTQLHH
ncbi:hypothetical protein DERF_002126 [Dermatophagoides farinae]|uniref:Uncharacterized protein n=1 Tax=Dermatophagoides farinae TaxID=6954 RepID=A0A922I9Z9_DERFA|nr:hypothetical protein DERF_002126 [Dermatophagoides farinae]